MTLLTRFRDLYESEGWDELSALGLRALTADLVAALEEKTEALKRAEQSRRLIHELSADRDAVILQDHLQEGTVKT
jgi:hypothetical protein